jgi:hypothetical protein
MVRLRIAALAVLLTCGLPVAGSARAQDAPQPGAAQPPAGPPRDVLVVVEQAPRPSEPALAPLYEDIEVMRRLLTRTFADAYGLPAAPTLSLSVTRAGQPGLRNDALTFTQSSAHPADVAHELPPEEGYYLKGRGVVFSATLPLPLGRDPVAVPDASAPKPLSDWERARRELRGGKPEPEARAPGRPRDVPLAEAVLRLLAENGHHVRQLPADEAITVAVTFREERSCANCHALTARITTAPQPPGEEFARVFRFGYDPAGPPQRAQLGLQPDEKASNRAPSAVNEMWRQMLVGDLHLKQGRSHEAAEAYVSALATADRAKAGDGRDLSALLAGVEASSKLAQAYLAMSRPEAARAALARAADYARRAEQQTGGPAKAAAPAGGAAPPLPAKMIVSAPKRLLDQVGAGGMTFEEFRKGATVEYLPFASPGKEGGRPAEKH